jgi:hypothetical protein
MTTKSTPRFIVGHQSTARHRSHHLSRSLEALATATIPREYVLAVGPAGLLEPISMEPEVVLQSCAVLRKQPRLSIDSCLISAAIVLTDIY